MICRRELRILKLEDFWEKVALQETYHLTILALFPAKLQTLAIGILVLVSQLSLYKQMCVHDAPLSTGSEKQLCEASEK